MTLTYTSYSKALKSHIQAWAIYTTTLASLQIFVMYTQTIKGMLYY